jgi:hypothetical protein
MKKSFFLAFVLCACFSLNISAQYSTNSSNTKVTQPSPDQNINFRLFQTNNIWNFLKLDTRSGVITQVQYSLEGNRMEFELNPTPLVHSSEQKPGRFFLYPTENTYNFILLDQISGKCWQVQWSLKENNRGVWPIY